MKYSSGMKRLNLKYAFSRPYISRVYPDESDNEAIQSELTDLEDATEGINDATSISFDEIKPGDEEIEYDKLKTRSIFSVQSDRNGNEAYIAKSEVSTADDTDILNDTGIFSISKSVTSQTCVSEPLTSEECVSNQVKTRRVDLDLPKALPLHTGASWSTLGSSQESEKNSKSSQEFVSKLVTSEEPSPIVASQETGSKETGTKLGLVTSRESVSTPAESVTSSGSQTLLLPLGGEEKPPKKSVSIVAPEPRRSSFSFFRNNLIQNGDAITAHAQDGASNKKGTRTPPLERLKSRKFSLSLGRLPEILTGKKTDDDKEKDGADSKQDGASTIDLSIDATEHKQDDYSHLIEPNRFAQVMTVLTVLIVFGILVALIVRISIQEDGLKQHDTDNTTTVAPTNTTRVT
ncbi:uncharacterized protein LOC135503163 isoform X2 [Lineus longissimus]|uniref:uncharacterized protein LOC135503163 isoform X2 n=1 Tax=Lineus longissimus TaxID=88925 RepID=UPI002B4F2E20